jgi:hypothetical protein
MDIIVTTPKFLLAESAQEAANCIADGGGEYFRRFGHGQHPNIAVGERVYYVEDGYVRGYAVVNRVMNPARQIQCDTTGRWYAPGFYVFMSSDSWRWIVPIPMLGFQGWRYARWNSESPLHLAAETNGSGGRKLYLIEEVGGWLDPMPPDPVGRVYERAK